MRMRTRILLLAAALVGVPALAGAQTLEDYDYENLAFRGVGFEVGQVWPHRAEGALELGIRADLGYLGPNVRIIPGITFWSSSLRSGVVDELRNNILKLCRDPAGNCVREFGEIRLSDVALNLDAQYTFPGIPGVVPYAGAGVALHLLNGQGEVIDNTFVEDQLDAIAPGIDLLAGAEIPLGRLRLFAEARGALASDVQYAGLHIGGMWSFPIPPAGARRPPATGGRP